MRRTYTVPLVILVSALALVGVVLLSGGLPRSSPYRLAALPTPGLVAPLTTPTPAGDAFIEYFPPMDTPSPQAIPAMMPTSVPAGESPVSTPTVRQEITGDQPAKMALLSLLGDWIYTDYTQVASTKRGRLEHLKTKEQRQIWEGMEFDNNIVVASLSPEAAIMKLGEATWALRMARRPAFFDEVARNPRPLSPQEQQEALEYYMRVYGDRLRELSKNYKPLPGVSVPSAPPTKEQIEKSKQKYMQMYGRRFQQEQMLRPTFSRASIEEQRRNFERYWRTYHPDKPMPPFPIQSNNTSQQMPLILPTESPPRTAQ